MSKITNLRMWKDIGYTEGMTELPPIGHIITKEPDFTYDSEITPSKDRLFTEMQIPVDYLTILDMSYITFTLDLNNSEDMQFYGWIDDIKLQSDTEGAPMVFIKWHIDPWRTFASKAVFGSGFVRRRPHTDHDFYQSYPYRYQVFDSNVDLINKGSGMSNYVPWWVIICSQIKEDNKITAVCWYSFPLVVPEPNQDDYWVSNVDMTTKGKCPRYDAVMAARLDDIYGINPSTITGAWLCPVRPMRNALNGIGSEDDCFRSSYTDWVVYTHEHSGTTYACFKINITPGSASILTPFWNGGGKVDLTATEEQPILVTGPLGETIGAIPFGKHIGAYGSQLVLNSTSAYIRFSFGQMSEGLVFMYLLPSIEVNENSWSQYVYSGQRQYDIDQRNTKTWSEGVQGAVSGGFMGGIIGAGTRNAAGSGKERAGIKAIAAGAGIGALGGPGGILLGAAIGAGASALASIAEGTIFNGQFQDQEDKLHASQPDSILISGDTNYMFFNTPGQVCLTKMKYDAESLAVINDIQSVQGVSYGQPMENCTELINGGGPMQISSLIVKGDIPITVKDWISKRFEAGVRIIAR